MAQADPAASIVQRCIETTTLLDAQLRHFPRHEQHGLCARLRNAAYDLYELIVEAQKRPDLIPHLPKNLMGSKNANSIPLHTSR